jgi:hypothetical protein
MNVSEIYQHEADIKDLDADHKHVIAQRLTQFICDQKSLETCEKAIRLLSLVSDHIHDGYSALFDQLISVAATAELNDQFTCCYTLTYDLESSFQAACNIIAYLAKRSEIFETQKTRSSKDKSTQHNCLLVFAIGCLMSTVLSGDSSELQDDPCIGDLTEYLLHVGSRWATNDPVLNKTLTVALNNIVLLASADNELVVPYLADVSVIIAQSLTSQDIELRDLGLKTCSDFLSLSDKSFFDTIVEDPKLHFIIDNIQALVNILTEEDIAICRIIVNALEPVCEYLWQGYGVQLMTIIHSLFLIGKNLFYRDHSNPGKDHFVYMRVVCYCAFYLLVDNGLGATHPSCADFIEFSLDYSIALCLGIIPPSRPEDVGHFVFRFCDFTSIPLPPSLLPKIKKAFFVAMQSPELHRNILEFVCYVSATFAEKQALHVFMGTSKDEPVYKIILETVVFAMIKLSQNEERKGDYFFSVTSWCCKVIRAVLKNYVMGDAEREQDFETLYVHPILQHLLGPSNKTFESDSACVLLLLWHCYPNESVYAVTSQKVLSLLHSTGNLLNECIQAVCSAYELIRAERFSVRSTATLVRAALLQCGEEQGALLTLQTKTIMKRALRMSQMDKNPRHSNAL